MESAAKRDVFDEGADCRAALFGCGILCFAFIETDNMVCYNNIAPKYLYGSNEFGKDASQH